MSPDQRSLYVVSRGDDLQWAVLVFDIDVPVTKSASLRSRTIVPDAHQLNGIVFHPTNESIFYVTDSLTTQCVGLIEALDVRCFERLMVFHCERGLLRTWDTASAFQLWLNSRMATASDERKFRYFSRSNYSAADATDRRRLDGLSATCWSDDSALLVTGGFVAIFPPGVAVSPHIFKLIVDPLDATNFISITEFSTNLCGTDNNLFVCWFVVNRFHFKKKKKKAQSMGIIGRCSSNCTTCRTNPSTFAAECHNCSISNGGCEGDAQCASDRDGENCIFVI